MSAPHLWTAEQKNGWRSSSRSSSFFVRNFPAPNGRTTNRAKCESSSRRSRRWKRKPLRLFIPVRNSWGGLTQAAGKFLGLPLKSKQTIHRGLRVVQVGLWLYDRYAAEGSLPPRSLHQPGEEGVPAVSRDIARRLWAYSDAQITFPERLVIDFLADARQLAQEKGIDFRVLTYSRA